MYTSHMQLGGPKVMAVNGVSHHIVEDDLAGCAAMLQWLAFVPAVLGSQPPMLASSDLVERPISYTPQPGAGHRELTFPRVCKFCRRSVRRLGTQGILLYAPCHSVSGWNAVNFCLTLLASAWHAAVLTAERHGLSSSGGIGDLTPTI